MRDLHDTPEDSGPAEEGPAVLAATDQAVVIEVRPIQDDRTPAGMVCQGTFIDERLVARCVVPPQALAFFQEQGVLSTPVRLALAAREAPPGLQCQLYALVALPMESVSEEEAEEPWAASVPGAGYEATVAEDDAPAVERQAAVLLGDIVRFDGDRKHPKNLALEAIDVLSTIVSGNVAEVVDRVLDDLLRNPPDGS